VQHPLEKRRPPRFQGESFLKRKERAKGSTDTGTPCESQGKKITGADPKKDPKTKDGGGEERQAALLPSGTFKRGEKRSKEHLGGEEPKSTKRVLDWNTGGAILRRKCP